MYLTPRELFAYYPSRHWSTLEHSRAINARNNIPI
jgi:hypothetical protein